MFTPPPSLAHLSRPSLVVDLAKVRRNCAHMIAKAKANGVRLRPHLKTHQSHVVGRLLRDLGLGAATVSSVSMAQHFADDGWNDLCVAFPINLRELPQIDALAGRIHLASLVDHPATVHALAEALHHPLALWIKIDVGPRRCGLDPSQHEEIIALAQLIRAQPLLRLAGLLTHDSRTYGVSGAAAVSRCYRDTCQRLNEVRRLLADHGIAPLEISVGDTPSAALVDDWGEVDEFRPGNFVYYDLQQLAIGSCTPADLAAAVACPVVGLYPARSHAVVYGGAVHLSKQSQPAMPEIGLPETHWGAVLRPCGEAWAEPIPGAWVASLTQEHGVVHLPPEILAQLEIGDLLLIAPVHACLAAHALMADTHYCGAPPGAVEA